MRAGCLSLATTHINPSNPYTTPLTQSPPTPSLTTSHHTQDSHTLHCTPPPPPTTHPLPQHTSPQHMHTYMHHLPCPSPISRTSASSGLAHDTVQRRSLHHPHYQGCSPPDCHATTRIRSHSQPSANTQPAHLKSHPRPAPTQTLPPSPLRTSHTPRPHTYTHTKQVELAHSRPIMHTHSQHHYLTNHPHHAGLPRHSTILLSPPPSLSLSLSRNHSHQPFKTIHMTQSPPTPSLTTSHHITHMTLILHTANPPPTNYTPTSTAHQLPTHAHAHASPPMPSAHLTYDSVVRLGT
jgi:hypothetical protein